MSENTLTEALKQKGLFPHQVDFVHEVLGAQNGDRILLADEIGLGKTVSCATALGEIVKRSGSSTRIFVITPRSLLGQWQQQLTEWASLEATIIDASFYRRMQARTGTHESPWQAVKLALTSMDFVKNDARLAELQSVEWDVVIIDEAHLYNVSSQRGKLLNSLWKSPTVKLLIAVTGTPNSGRAEDYQYFIDRQAKVIRRLRKDMLDWDNKPLRGISEERIIEVVRTHVSNAERDFFNELIETLRQREVIGLAQASLLRRAASSLFSIEQTLRRIAVPRELLPFSASDEPLESLEENENPDQPHSSALSISDAARLLNLFEEIEADSKLNALENIITRSRSENLPTIIFCEFTDTALYLRNYVESLDVTVDLITSEQSIQEREFAVNRFRIQSGVLVLTSVIAESLRLSFVKSCIHYDLPWNIARLHQRFGRVHRFDSPPGAVKHWFVDDDFFAVGRLIEKVINLRETPGDCVELSEQITAQLTK